MAAVVKGSMMYSGEDDTSSDEDVRLERHEEAPVLLEHSIESTADNGEPASSGARSLVSVVPI